MLQYLVLLSLITAAYGAWVYLKEMVAGRAKPNKVSWLMWAVAPLIATFAAMSKGVTWAVLPVFMSGFVPLLIFIVSLFNKKSYWKLRGFDYLCGFFSVVALVLWLITKEANIAIVFAIVSDGFASVPTLKKAWINPETEPVVPYLAGLVGALTSFAAIEHWTFSEYAFPVYISLMIICLIVSIENRRIFKR
jgi:hypothetical protein